MCIGDKWKWNPAACSLCYIETLSIFNQRQAAQPFRRRLYVQQGHFGHWGCHSCCNRIHGCETQRVPAFISTEWLCSFNICYCFHPCFHLLFVFCFVFFDPLYLVILPSFVASLHSCAEESVYATAPTWIVHEVCAQEEASRCGLFLICL